MNPFEVWIFLDYLIFFKIEIQISEGVIAEADLNNHSDIDHTLSSPNGNIPAQTGFYPVGSELGSAELVTGETLAAG